jgi:hypothetical protein
MTDNVMLTNYIYLLQEREFIKTKENIYKVGRTKKENYQRFNQYPKGSILLFQMICNNCENIETQIIKQFKEKFNQQKNIGNEYFEGDCNMMIDIIYSTIKNETYIKDEINLTFDDNEPIYCDDDCEDTILRRQKRNYLIKKIKLEFPDYEYNKYSKTTYIKIKKNDNNYVIIYVNPKLPFANFGECIIQHTMNANVADKLEYFNTLLKSKVLLLNKIYDIDSEDFITKIEKTKIKINFNDYNEYVNFRDFHYKNVDDYEDSFEKRLKELFYCGLIINDDLYCTSVKECENRNSLKIIDKIKADLSSFDNFSVDIGINHYIMTTIYKINSNFYDYPSCLRKYLPYLIEWDSNHNYYLLNRDYEYIGTLSKHRKHETTNQIYLFNDGNKPWESKEDYINMCIKYQKTIAENQLLNCKNSNSITKELITLFD